MSRTIKILYALSGAAAALGIVSAIGSTCVSLDPFWQKGPFAIAGEYQLVWVITYFMTWLAGLAWGVLFWGLKTRKSWFYPAALVTSVIGFIGRGVPAILMTYGFLFFKPRKGLMFTPSWAFAILSLAILVVLLLPKYKQGINDYMKDVSASSGGSVGSQVSSFAYVLFGFGIVMILQPFIMPTHIIEGVNIGTDRFGELLASGLLQLGSGIFCILLGIITRIAGQVLSIVSTPKPTPLKV